MCTAVFVGCVLLIQLTCCAKEKDLVETLPGWDGPIPFKMYSGYIKVDTISKTYDYYMHYVFMESTTGKSTDPVVLWQQGGPGSSSISVGLFTEMGYFQLNDDSPINSTTGLPSLLVNPYSWNHYANMLYFDHPAGVDFSYCTRKNDTVVDCPIWNDVTQAEELYAALYGWFSAFPEFSHRDVYFTGESYSGLYVPSLAYHYSQQKSPNFKLKGFAVGNGCIGVPGQSVSNPGNCNGPVQVKIHVDILFGHALYSKLTYDKINRECKFPIWNATKVPKSCIDSLHEMSNETGPYNVYNVYDNCGRHNMVVANNEATTTYADYFKTFEQWAGKDFRGLDNLAQQGGNEYACGAFHTTHEWLRNSQVQTALHIAGKHRLSAFHYKAYTWAAIDHYPELIKKYRVMIYNGDVDSVCPYNQNEQWTSGLGLSVYKRWKPWYTVTGDHVTAGALTQYDVPGATWKFSFITVRESGHMVPHYQPYRAYVMMQRYLTNTL